MTVTREKHAEINEMVERLHKSTRMDPNYKTIKEQAEYIRAIGEDDALLEQLFPDDADCVAALKAAIYARAQQIDPSINPTTKTTIVRKTDTMDDVDIYVMPHLAPAAAREITQITIGDLHANPIKLIYLLIHHGVCEITADSYNKLVDIYKKIPQHVAHETSDKHNEINCETHTLRNDFCSIMHNELHFVNSERLIRLIGDVLGDRGKNDLLILDVLDTLQRAKVEVRTLLGNHDGLFIEAFNEAINGRPFIASLTLVAGQSNSLDQLAQLLLTPETQAKATWNDVKQIVNRAYFPCLKLIDYSIGDDGNITLFSHAPIDLEVIYFMAMKYNIPYEPQTPETLAKTIDQINQIVVSKLSNGLDYKALFDQDKVDSAGLHIRKEDSIEYITWNRNEDLTGANIAPNLNYTIIFVHGHTQGGIIHDRNRQVYNLDNYLGKVTNPDEDDVNQYKVFISNDDMNQFKRGDLR